MYAPGTKVRFVQFLLEDVPQGTVGTVRGEGNGLLVIDLPPGVQSWGRDFTSVEWDPDTIALDIIPTSKVVRSVVAVEAAMSAFWQVLEDLYPESKSIVAEGPPIPTAAQEAIRKHLRAIS